MQSSRLPGTHCGVSCPPKSLFRGLVKLRNGREAVMVPADPSIEICLHAIGAAPTLARVRDVMAGATPAQSGLIT